MRRDSMQHAARAVADASIGRGLATYRVRFAVAAVVLLCALPAFGQLERVRAAQLQPDRCVDGQPRVVLVVDSSSIGTCAPGSTGTAEALCCCLDGTWASCAADTTGYVTGATVNQGLVASLFPITLGLIDCAAGEVLKRDSGDTEWECAADDTGGGGGGSVALDLGDDGSNESSGLTEIATENDDYDAVTEPSANKMLIDFARIAPYQKYDPDRPPSGCSTCEEWTGDTASLTWRWANQNTATETINLDSALLTGSDNNELMVRFTDAPTNTDQTVTARISQYDGSSSSESCGIIVLHGGTEASPTDVSYTMMGDFSTDGIFAQIDSDYSPTSGASAIGNDPIPLDAQKVGTHYHQIRYVDSTRVATFAYSSNGLDWTELGTDTLTNDPISWGFFARRVIPCRVHWFRIRTDSEGNSDPYPAGE